MPLGQGHTGDKLTDSKASAICAMWPDALLRIWQQLSRETNHLSFLPARDIFVLCISHGRLVAKATTSTPTWLDSKQICFLLISVPLEAAVGGEDPAPGHRSGLQGPSILDPTSFYALASCPPRRQRGHGGRVWGSWQRGLDEGSQA